MRAEAHVASAATQTFQSYDRSGLQKGPTDRDPLPTSARRLYRSGRHRSDEFMSQNQPGLRLRSSCDTNICVVSQWNPSDGGGVQRDMEGSVHDAGVTSSGCPTIQMCVKVYYRYRGAGGCLPLPTFPTTGTLLLFLPLRSPPCPHLPFI